MYTISSRRFSDLFLTAQDEWQAKIIIDGADILRGPNRDNFSSLLVDTLASEFEHVVVLAACDAVEAEKQYNGELEGRITKWLVQNGEVVKV
jgi:hypothetical protein